MTTVFQLENCFTKVFLANISSFPFPLSVKLISFGLYAPMHSYLSSVNDELSILTMRRDDKRTTLLSHQTTVSVHFTYWLEMNTPTISPDPLFIFIASITSRVLGNTVYPIMCSDSLLSQVIIIEISIWVTVTFRSQEYWRVKIGDSEAWVLLLVIFHLKL